MLRTPLISRASLKLNTSSSDLPFSLAHAAPLPMIPDKLFRYLRVGAFDYLGRDTFVKL